MDIISDEKVVILVVTAVLGVITMWFCFGESKPKRPVTLDSVNKIPLTLSEKTVISHDTRQFRFSLPTSNHILGLPVGSFINVSATLENKLVVRPYTPITSDDEVGYMDLMIKVYKEGKMSSYIDQLNIGDQIMVRGPSGKIRYLGKGKFEVQKSKNDTLTLYSKKIGMVAGGSGITPMLQIIRDVIKNADDETNLSLLFSNKTEDDILCRAMLEEMLCPKLTVHHTLTQQSAPPDWKHNIGRVNKDMLSSCLPGPADDTVILVCGPPGLVKQTCLPLLLELGHQTDHILMF